MTKKWLALMAAFGLALTITACGGDDDELTTCTSNDDCADDESCDTSCGFCAPAAAADRCTSDESCAEGETCQPIADGCTVKKCKTAPTSGTACESDEDCAGAADCDTSCKVCVPTASQCTADTDCAEGETCKLFDEGCALKTCQAGTGPTACTEQNQCYPDQFCDLFATDKVCIDIATVATCSAAHGQNSVPTNGIMLWAQGEGDFGGDEGNCITHTDASVCPATAHWCSFAISVYDPDNSLPLAESEKAALYKRVVYSTASGSWVPTGDVDPYDDETFIVYGCFSSTSLNGAVAIVDDNTKASPTLQSNAICLSATAN